VSNLLDGMIRRPLTRRAAAGIVLGVKKNGDPPRPTGTQNTTEEYIMANTTTTTAKRFATTYNEMTEYQKSGWAILDLFRDSDDLKVRGIRNAVYTGKMTMAQANAWVRNTLRKDIPRTQGMTAPDLWAITCPAFRRPSAA
jgi:hypothetical protein